MKIETPSNSLVAQYIEKFNNDERYYPVGQAIIKLFSESLSRIIYL